MGMTLSNADLRPLLPQFMQDDASISAFVTAVNDLIRSPGSKVKRLREWDQIDNLTGPELDELAYEMGIEWYDSTVPIENKRATIAAARKLKDKSGTVWAVIEAVKAAYGVEPEITEWFDYNGTAGHFRMNLQAQNDFDFARILRAVNYVKRASATLDGTTLQMTVDAPLFVGFATVSRVEYTNDMTSEGD